VAKAVLSNSRISQWKNLINCRSRTFPIKQRRQVFCWSISSLEISTSSEPPSGYWYPKVWSNHTNGLADSTDFTAVVLHVEVWPRSGQRVSARLIS